MKHHNSRHNFVHNSEHNSEHTNSHETVCCADDVNTRKNNSQDHGHHGHGHGHGPHNHTVYSEIVCHLPYAVFASAFALAILSFVSVNHTNPAQLCKTSNSLFHSFHFMHIVFAATGTLITFLRFSQSKMRALVVAIISPAIFCTLSDAIIPYFAGKMMGVSMTFHLCFLTEWHNIIPFFVAGLINGFILGEHHESKQEVYSLFSHVVHILVSSLASLFYLVANGCTNWFDSIGMVFIFLVIAVVVPCTLSDIVVPIFLAKK